MRWLDVFIKGVKEQVREFWILIMIVVMAPLFIAIYYLMAETEDPEYDVILVNLDLGTRYQGKAFNLGDSIIGHARLLLEVPEMSMLKFSTVSGREQAMERLRNKQADVLVVLPEDLSLSVMGPPGSSSGPARLEMVGDVTRMEYIVGAVWSEELINQYVLRAADIRMPVSWTETTLGFSGRRTYFELYVPGLLILSIIMIIFSASAAIVREPEIRTLERLKISRLTALEFLGGISLVQILLAILSMVLALLTAIALGYTVLPGTLGFILLISLLTALSMVSFSLLVAAMCRSVKEVAIIGTFPLFLLMFFTGAAFPISGGELFTLGEYTVRLNHLLSPTFAVEAMNKVLIRGLSIKETLPDMAAILLLTLIYFASGTWAFRRRHMRAR
ncbi:MAG: ABC transporter permease [Bacteroidia bacterium]|nr:MAG: ABC transporter permease [Bacteroidia bacterium]